MDKSKSLSQNKIKKLLDEVYKTFDGKMIRQGIHFRRLLQRSEAMKELFDYINN